MYNYFLQNPIKINILDVLENKLYIDYKIIFLGDIPTNIKNNILNFDAQKSPKILKEYYGKDWNDKLELISNKYGSNELTTSEDMINFDDFNLDDLDDFNYEGPIEETIINSNNIDSNVKKDVIYNTDIFILPEDNIKILKEKIFLATNIHIYKQNISLFNYNVFIDKLKYDISFNNIEKLQKINKLPIDLYLYENRDNITIHGHEYSYLYSYFQEYNSIEFNLLDLEKFIINKSDYYDIIKKDKQQTDMIYYSFIMKYFPMFSYEMFKMYILFEDVLSETYPLLHLNYNSTKMKYEKEINMIRQYDSIDNLKYSQFVKTQFTFSIIEREFFIKSINNLNKINIRNLFDNIEIVTIPNINYIKSNIIVDNKNISLTKINNNSKNIQEIEFDNNSILFSIHIIYPKFNIFENDNIYMILVINEIGDIILKVFFKDLFEINNEKLFEIIDKIINPILNNINNKLIYTDNRLASITKYNNEIKNSIIHLFWNNEISSKGFFNLLDKLKDYIFTGIINIKSERLVNNEIEYSINKGMVNFNDKLIEKYVNNVKNYFLYYSNGDIKILWNRIFVNTKTFSLKNKINNLKLELNNITELELEFISEIIYKFLYINKKNILIEGEEIQSSPLKILKRTDPKLFIIKDPKTNKDMYSRKCQKKLQPVIVSKSFINDSNKESITKFWNFTKNKEEYYFCPNKNYPFVKFLTNIHPDNYCVPCCKKKDSGILDIGSKSKIIYNECLSNYKYDIKKSKLDSSRYIMSYGKELEINRIMELPNDLDSIINDKENKTEKYYIYGIVQNHNNNFNIGIITILSDLYEMTLIEYIKSVILFLKSNISLFSFLLGGKLIYNFTNMEDLLINITNTFIHNKIICNTFDLWNELFIDISSHMSIRILLFKDLGSIELTIEKNIKYVNDIFPIYENSKYVIILEKKLSENNITYNPIYLINPKKHFKYSEITQKIFNNTNKIIIELKKMYNYYLMKNLRVYHIFDLKMISEFITYFGKMNIEKYYINNFDKCYGILINFNNKKLYLSIHESFINLLDDDIKNKIIYKHIDMSKYSININSILEFIYNYNIFIYQKIKNEGDIVEEKILFNEVKSNNKDSDISFNFDIVSNYKYKFLRISEFVEFDNKIIGVVCNGLLFYINPIITINLSINIINNSLEKMKKIISSKENGIRDILIREFDLTKSNINNNSIKNLYIKELLYNPFIINNIIINNEKLIKDKRITDKNKSLYNTYLYSLILLQFQKEFNFYKEFKLRNQIKNCINNLSIDELSNNYFKTTDNKIYKTMGKFFDSLIKINNEYVDILNISYINIIKIIIFYINKNISSFKELKTLIINEIKNNIFQFDKLFIIKFKNMEKKELLKELKNISEKIFDVRDKDIINYDFNFPNILLPCKEDSSTNFCNKSKLIITKKNLDMYLDILTGDIYNPIKNQYIFSTFFVNNNINILNFKIYINEKIYISN